MGQASSRYGMDYGNMRYTDDELIPISYISQFEYCKRRAGLLFLEQQWNENVHTAEGSIVHERVHSGFNESRGDLVLLRDISIVSYKLGLVGKTDCIELTRNPHGDILPGLDGKWLICPVEYKHGDVRDELEYELQVCAQAICIEEMCDCHIEYGYLFYEGAHRRLQVIFNDEKRSKVEKTVAELHKMQQNGDTPAAIKTSRCNGCSMYDVCLPNKLKNPSSYLQKLMKDAGGDSS